MQPAGGIQEHQVVAVLFGVLNGGFGNIHGVGLPHLENGDIQLGAHGFQLLDGGGTVNVTGHQQRALALLAHIAGQLGTVGGLAGALQAHQHHHAGGFGADIQLLVLPAHEGAQLLIDDLDDHLGRGQSLQHVGPAGPVSDGLGEAFDHFIADVRLQKGHTHLAHGFLHVRRGKAALAPQLLEGYIQFFG